MSKLYDLKEIVEATGLPERTVRYYLAKVVKAPSGTPGRKSYFDQITVDQLMLAQQILMRDYDPDKGEVKPTLSEFQSWMESLSADEIRELAEMPYRIKPKTLTSWHASKENKQTKSSTLASDSASEYLERVVSRQSPPRPHARRVARRPAQWEKHDFGPGLQINTRTPLTSKQRQQIKLAGKLLQSILEGQ